MNKRNKAVLHKVLSILVTLFVSILALFPLYWILITSLKVPGTEYRLPIEYWPSTVSLESYRTILSPGFTFQTALKNSLIISSAVTLLGLFLASMAAYTIARLRFRYKWSSLVLIQVASMLPPIVTIAPTFLIIRSLGWLGDIRGLILPNIVYSIPMSTWLVASYFAGLPFELEDAAKTDGTHPWKIYWTIMLPLAAPGLFSAGVITFLGSWGEFMLALTISMGLPSAQTVPVAVNTFSIVMMKQWTWISAATVLSLVPVVALVIIFQKWVVQGLALGSSKY